MVSFEDKVFTLSKNFREATKFSAASTRGTIGHNQGVDPLGIPKSQKKVYTKRRSMSGGYV